MPYVVYRRRELQQYKFTDDDFEICVICQLEEGVPLDQACACGWLGACGWAGGWVASCAAGSGACASLVGVPARALVVADVVSALVGGFGWAEFG